MSELLVEQRYLRKLKHVTPNQVTGVASTFFLGGGDIPRENGLHATLQGQEAPDLMRLEMFKLNRFHLLKIGDKNGFTRENLKGMHLIGLGVPNIRVTTY